MKNSDHSLEERIIDLLLTATTARQTKGARIAVAGFQDAVIHDTQTRSIIGDDEASALDSATPDDLSGPLMASGTLSLAEDEWEPTEDIAFVKARQVPFVEALKCNRRLTFSKRIVEYTLAGFRMGAATFSARTVFVGWEGGRWVGLEGEAPHPLTTSLLGGLCADQFCARYEWRVSLGIQGGPSVAFETDPTGAREVFRLRDLPDGSQRRSALLHWVGEHWRKRRSDPSEETKVRAHLRGQTEFVWNGMRCRIRPSDYDAERARMPRASTTPTPPHAAR